MIYPKFCGTKETLPAPDSGRFVLYDMFKAPKGTSIEEWNRNVYRITKDGDFLWQISAPEGRYARSPFVNIFFEADGKLKALRWDGFLYEVNPETGEAAIVDFRK